MLEVRYKKAYSTITPSQELVSDTIRMMRTGKKAAGKRLLKKRFVMKASLTAAIAVLCFVMAVPVGAAHIPAFYKIVEYLSPAMADRLVPIEQSCTSQGITMQVEAIHLEGNEAEIIISLSDAKDSTQDLVHGEMDLYDSYRLSDYMSDSTVGGCHFLTYDQTDDKAYFQVTVQSDNRYRGSKFRFSARSVLCDKTQDTRDVDLSGIVYTAETKLVTLRGSGGPLREAELPDHLKNISGTEEDPETRTNVMDLVNAADCAVDDFTLTGIVYMDGVLRVQICMGDARSADRHVELFLQNSAGEERYPDHSVSWDEAIGENVNDQVFYEFWYIEDIEDIADYSMYGIFHDSGELVNGDWSVTFRLQGA